MELLPPEVLAGPQRQPPRVRASLGVPPPRTPPPSWLHFPSGPTLKAASPLQPPGRAPSYFRRSADGRVREAPGHHLWPDRGRRRGASGTRWLRPRSSPGPPAASPCCTRRNPARPAPGPRRRPRRRGDVGTGGERLSGGRVWDPQPSARCHARLAWSQASPSVRRALGEPAVESPSVGGGCGERVFLSPEVGPRVHPTPRGSRDLQPRPGGQGAGIGASEADPGAGRGDVVAAGEREAGGDHVGQPGVKRRPVGHLGNPWDTPLCRRGRTGQWVSG